MNVFAGQGGPNSRAGSGPAIGILQQTWLPAPRGVPLKPDGFGLSIALKNAWLAVGAPRDDNAAMQSGAVFLYRQISPTNGVLSFVLQQVIYSPSAQWEAGFGSSVALADSRLVVGNPGTDLAGQRHHGRAYVYQLAGTNWIQVGQVAPPPSSTGEFGAHVGPGPIGWRSRHAFLMFPRTSRRESRSFRISLIQIRRREPAFVGLSYSLETSEDLQHWTVFQQPPRSAVQISPEWERITYSLPIPDVQNQRFCRVRVELNSIAAAPRR